MSTAEQIAVMQAHLEGKRIESKVGADVWTLIPKYAKITWNWKDCTYRVAEEPREPRVWSLKHGGVFADDIRSGPRLGYGEVVRVTELPDGWEVRRKETQETDGWRYFKMHLHSWKSDGVTTLYKGGGDWVDSVTTLEELLGDKRIIETDAAGRPLP